MRPCRRFSLLLLLASGACLAEDPFSEHDREVVGSETAEISGGTVVPLGELEAVVRVNFVFSCAGTLITDSIVLTAAHCVCADDFGNGCRSRDQAQFRDVVRHDNPATPENEEGTRGDVLVFGRVVVHPDMAMGNPLRNDLAVILLDRPISEKAVVSPIPISSTMPAVGDNLTIVGYGPSEGPMGECSVQNVTKRKTTTQVDQVAVNPVGDTVVILDDGTRHACGGDSGGPAIDSSGRVAGVISSGNFTSTTNLRAVPAHLEWITLQGSSPGGRVGLWDVSGNAPAPALYADDLPDPLGLLGWIDTNDLRLVGDFFHRGHDQVLYVNRNGIGGRVRIADYADGAGPTESLYWENHGERRTFDGWLDSNDVHLVGDFLRLGHDQLLLINRAGSGGRIMIVGFETGEPVVLYSESYGQDGTLNGWHDAEDGFLVGDFTGDGHDTVLFVNRGVGGGRILIADFSDGQVPAQVRYYETYAQGVQLNGWHDADDYMFAGDFRGLGRDQVLFLNRGRGDGRVLVADFGDGLFPAEWHLYLTTAQAAVLDGWLDNEDVALAGRFRAGAVDQLALVNRGLNGFGRVQIAELAGPSIKLQFVQNQVPASAILPRIHSDDPVLAGDLRGTGLAQLLTLENLDL